MSNDRLETVRAAFQAAIADLIGEALRPMQREAPEALAALLAAFEKRDVTLTVVATAIYDRPAGIKVLSADRHGTVATLAELELHPIVVN